MSDKARFLALGAWNIVTRELLLREELKQRGISYDTLPHMFPALEVPLFPPHHPRDPHLHLHHPMDPLHHLRHYQYPNCL